MAFLDNMEGKYKMYDGEIDIYSLTEAQTFEYEFSGNQLILTQEGSDNQAVFVMREQCFKQCGILHETKKYKI